MLQFGLRLGSHPRQMVTTTPRPIPLLKRFLADPQVAVSRVRTADNAENLAPVFLDTVVRRYAGTRLGRQELDGDIVEDRPDALWTRDMIETNRTDAAPPLVRIVVAVDPPASSSKRADACGIVAAGVDEGGIAYVLEDATRIRIEAARMGGEGGGALSAARGRCACRRDEPGRRDGDRRDPRGRSRRAGGERARDPRQVSARRAGLRALCAEPRAPCGRAARSSRTSCAISARAACPPAARPTAWMRSSGRSPS